MVLGNVLIGLGTALSWLFQLYMYVLFGRAIISWVDASPRNPIVQFLIMATEPPRRIVARMLPSSLRYFPLDIAFLVLVALCIFLQFAVAQTIIELGQGMKMQPSRGTLI